MAFDINNRDNEDSCIDKSNKQAISGNPANSTGLVWSLWALRFAEKSHSCLNAEWLSSPKTFMQIIWFTLNICIWCLALNDLLLGALEVLCGPGRWCLRGQIPINHGERYLLNSQGFSIIKACLWKNRHIPCDN